MNEQIEYDIKVNIEPRTRRHYAMIGMGDLLVIIRVFEFYQHKVGLGLEQEELYNKLMVSYHDRGPVDKGQLLEE